MTEGGSIVVRRQLGRELRAWRERARRTLDDVATAQIASVSKVHRIEHGRTSVRPGDVRELCRLYGVAEDAVESLVDLARGTRDPDWWERLDGAAPVWFELYLRLELVASAVCIFQPMLIHGLLQTEAYAREVQRAGEPIPDVEQVERYVATRLARQRRVFERDRPLRLRVALGETALLTRVGPEQVMAAQREHLRWCAEQPHVDLRVLPFTAGAHPGHLGAFSVLEFPDPDDPPVAYVEMYDAARYPEAPTQVKRYRQRFERIWALGVPMEEWPT
jgi:transcriptional regulator with XRE-family HTH domain